MSLFYPESGGDYFDPRAEIRDGRPRPRPRAVPSLEGPVQSAETDQTTVAQDDEVVTFPGVGPMIKGEMTHDEPDDQPAMHVASA